MSKKSKTEPVAFETLLNELEQVVESMEQGGMQLETALAQFERGAELVKRCQQKLHEANQRVQQWVKTDGDAGHFIEFDEVAASHIESEE